MSDESTLRERIANKVAKHDAYRVNDDGWTVCICGHVAVGDTRVPRRSHAGHVAEVVTRLVKQEVAAARAEGIRKGRGELRDAEHQAFQRGFEAAGDAECEGCERVVAAVEALADEFDDHPWRVECAEPGSCRECNTADAIRAALDAAEKESAVRANLDKLDGTDSAAVSLMTGLTADDLEDLGGIDG